MGRGPRPSERALQDRSRTHKHLDELRQLIPAAIQGEPFELYAKPVPHDPHEFSLHVSAVNPPDPYWGALIGDIANNCRSALDYIAYVLRVRGGYFPLYDDRERFLNEGVPKLSRLNPGHAALIEGAQPCYGMAKPVSRHPGSILRAITRMDKHRILTTVLMGQESILLTISVNGREVQRSLTIESRVLEDDAEVGRFNTAEFAPYDVEVYAGLKSRIYVEGKWPLVLATKGVIDYVENDVIARFAPIIKNF